VLFVSHFYLVRLNTVVITGLPVNNVYPTYICPSHKIDLNWTGLSTFSEHTHTHTTVLRLCGICPGKPGWAGTRRNIHPLLSS